MQQALQKGDVDELASLARRRRPTNIARSARRTSAICSLRRKAQFQPVPDGKPIKPGSRDPAHPAVVAARCSAVGYRRRASSGCQPHSSAHDSFAALVAAVKRLQGELGIKPDGVIGGDTLDALNRGPGVSRAAAGDRDGAAALACSAIRRRRGSTSTPPRRSSITGGTAQHVDHRNVVVGEPDKPTPQLQAPIVQLVAKPTWTRA